MEKEILEINCASIPEDSLKIEEIKALNKVLLLFSIKDSSASVKKRKTSTMAVKFENINEIILFLQKMQTKHLGNNERTEK